MATLRFRGDAPAVAQVTTATPANVEVGDTFSLAVNGKAASYVAQAATVADVAAGLAAAFAASAEPEFGEIEAQDAGTHVTLAARTPGKPFAVAAATTNGGATDDQTLTLATPVPSAGPNHWDSPANWSGGAVPADGDDVYLENSAVSLLHGLAQGSVLLSSLNIAASYTGQIGLAVVNEDNARPYAEYRPRRLAIAADEVRIGRGLGGGSGRIQLDTGSDPTSVTVHGTGLAAEDDLPAVLWLGDHGANTLDVHGGTVGVALEGGDTALLATLRIAGGEVRCGQGLEVEDVECSGGGRLVLEAEADSITQSGGEALVLGSAGLGTVILTGGRLVYRGSGPIGALELDGGDALVDFSGDLRQRAVGSCTLRRGTILDPHQTVTWTGGIQPAGGVQAV
jgi:hypothetical protein